MLTQLCVTHCCLTVYNSRADAVMEGQAAAAGGAAGRVRVGEGNNAVFLDLPRAALLPELRRHKRSFLKLTTQHSGSQLSDAQSARRMFAEYLADHVI